MSFAERAENMGLTNHEHGCFYYGDVHAEVLYRSLKTVNGAEMMDDYEVPYLAIFTKETGIMNQDWRYCGVISDSYKFEGNEVINEAIRSSINEIGTPILREDTILNYERTQMHHNIIIQNSRNIPEFGDIYPQITVTNSYSGGRAKCITFGLNMNEASGSNVSFGFRTKLGELRQVHHEGHATTMAAPIGGYVTAFTENITDLFQQNYNNQLTDDDMLQTLELIEKVGKKRRGEISTMIEEATLHRGNRTSWQMFLALTKFSTAEQNLNAKRIIEDIAERVLIVPEQLLTTMARVNN